MTKLPWWVPSEFLGGAMFGVSLSRLIRDWIAHQFTIGTAICIVILVWSVASQRVREKGKLE